MSSPSRTNEKTRCFISLLSLCGVWGHKNFWILDPLLVSQCQVTKYASTTFHAVSFVCDRGPVRSMFQSYTVSFYQGCFGYPLSIFFIVVNEFCERFSYYGMRGNDFHPSPLERRAWVTTAPNFVSPPTLLALCQKPSWFCTSDGSSDGMIICPRPSTTRLWLCATWRRFWARWSLTPGWESSSECF